MVKAFNKFTDSTSLTSDFYTIYKALKFTDFKQDTLTKPQFEAMKRVLRRSISFLKNYEDNNVIASISEFLLDYTIVEFDEQPNGKGILYIDAEGLITNLYEKFASPNKRSPMAGSAWFITPKPFLIIGASYFSATSSNNNLLGATENLNSLYFASEKVGIKFTFMDKKYTRSFQPGEQYMFKGKKYYWLRPQKEPLIVRQELMLYGSGLLYNIVNVKSSKNFEYALAGLSYGFTFFNGLNFNVGASVPINANNGATFKEKILLGASFDIPIIEYLTAIRKKRNQ